MVFEITFQGKTVIITGGSRGIGASCCEQFAKAGADVAIVYHTHRQEAERLSERLTKEYPQQVFRVYQLEAQIEKQNKLVVEQVIKDFKNPVAAVIANAGVSIGGPALEMTESTFDEVYGINVKGVFFISQAIARHWIEKKLGGAIVVTASMSGHISNTPNNQVIYNSSKAAVKHLARCLAAEWAPHNIRVLSTSPGYIATDMSLHSSPDMKKLKEEKTPQGRYGTAEEVANLMLYLASELSNFMTGSDVLIDGGYTIW